MRRMMLLGAVAVVVVVLASEFGCGGSGDDSQSADQARWEITDLGTLAASINKRGQIVGNYAQSTGGAFLWQKGRTAPRH